MHDFDWELGFALGRLLLIALVAGGMAGVVRLPKVTAYLLVGVVLGPVLRFIDEEQVAAFEPLAKLAISLVVFNLGAHFPLARARRILRRVMRISVGEQGATFVLVAAGLALLGEPWQVAVLLGALAMATAPATTMLVLGEAESEGPVTEYARALVALNNLGSILVFEILFLAVLFLGGGLETPVAEKLQELFQDLAGSVALGVAAGLIVSYSFTLVAPGRRLILLFAVIMLLLGLTHQFKMPYLLAFLAMGVTVANTSDRTREVLAELDRMTGLLCVVFFVVHGADLQLHALPAAQMAGVAYIVLRVAGKYLGTRVVAVRSGEEPAVCHWLGATLTAQAGAAIALSAIAVERTQGSGALNEMALHVQTVILGTVVVFEIFGPIFIRQAVVQAGEVPLAHAIYHGTGDLLGPLRTVLDRLLLALGRDPLRGRSASNLNVGELMRRNVKPIAQSATFADVVDTIEHSRDNTFPVVGLSGELVGVIHYRDLSSALFDPELGSLVRAADIMTAARRTLQPGEPISRACEVFNATKDDCIPVISAEEPHALVGLVRRRDVLRMLVRWQFGDKGASH